MKLVILPPYKLMGVTTYSSGKEGQFVIQEIIGLLRRKGQLDGVDIDIADAYPRENPSPDRDELMLAEISPGVLTRVRELCALGKYDAIISNGAIEPAFYAAREISTIPLVSGPHAAVHLASLVGERFTIIELRDVMAQILKNFITVWGFQDKLASIRTISRTSTKMLGFIHNYPREKYSLEERIKVPGIKEAVDEAVAQSIKAIENDRADTLILGCIPFQCLEEEVRKGLDDAGYDEIQIITPVRAAVEMAKAMVNLKLMSSPRCYPKETLRAVPEFRR